MSQPTIKDVAKLAGVSISTVSRVMNASKPVSKEARIKVENAIKKLDFKPNELARRLVMKKSNSIGVLVKDIGIEYMAQIIRGIEEVGKLYDYDILISSNYGDSGSEKDSIDFMIRKQVEGLILLAEDAQESTIEKIEHNRIPYIRLDRFSSDDFKTVSVDYSKAMYMMAKHLINNGHSKILYISNDLSRKISSDKMHGYKKAMEENNYTPEVLTIESNTADHGYSLIQKFLSSHNNERFTAVMCGEDEIAVGVLNYCYDLGIKVPDELTVTGFGNSKITELVRPRLTTVHEPYYDIGAVSVRMLIKMLSKEVENIESVFLTTDLKLRDSDNKLI